VISENPKKKEVKDDDISSDEADMAIEKEIAKELGEDSIDEADFWNAKGDEPEYDYSTLKAEDLEDDSFVNFVESDEELLPSSDDEASENDDKIVKGDHSSDFADLEEFAHILEDSGNTDQEPKKKGSSKSQGAKKRKRQSSQKAVSSLTKGKRKGATKKSRLK